MYQHSWYPVSYKLYVELKSSRHWSKREHAIDTQ